MDKKEFIRLSFYRPQCFSRLILPLVCAFLYLFGIAVTPTISYAAGVPGGNIANPTIRAVDIAKPAVVRIVTTLGGHLTVHFTPSISVNFPLNGGTYQMRLSGSGTFISAHGDILTADHVVDPPHDQELNDYLYTLAADDIANYINQNLHPDPPYTKDEAAFALTNNVFRSETSFGKPKSDVYLSTDYTGPLGITDMDKVPTGAYATVDTIKKYSKSDERDTAIIHVNMDDTPSVPLGDPSNVAQQDELTIIGFPGNGDLSKQHDPTQFLTSSVNKVFVSALKLTDTGAPVIQVGGNIEHGDSGGPALDSNGNIVGIVSFDVAHDTPVGTAFLQSSATAQDLARQANLDMKPGPFQVAWHQAFVDFAATTPGHWHKAQKDFNKLSTKYDLFQAVTPFMNYVETQANHEQLPAQDTSYIWYIVAGAVVLLLIVLGLVFLGLRRGKKLSAPPPLVEPSPLIPPSPPAITQWQQHESHLAPVYPAEVTEAKQIISDMPTAIQEYSTPSQTVEIQESTVSPVEEESTAPSIPVPHVLPFEESNSSIINDQP